VERIVGDIKTWLGDSKHLAKSTVDDVRGDKGFRVQNFPDLVKKVAHLSFHNPGFEMLFRGQSEDHPGGGHKSALLPPIFRTSGYFTKELAEDRFTQLEKAEHQLCLLARFKGRDRVCRHRLLQWAIIQHYEICSTPLLDVTHSLRVACSFSKRNKDNGDTFLYVLGVPYLSGCITTAGDQGIQVLRLLSVCPPVALRPHFQEAYLVGEYPELSFEAKDKYNKEEWDLGRRLICKFVLPETKKFWSNNYKAVPDEMLLPKEDPLNKLAQEVKEAIVGDGD
jgi:hypothetical protein